MKQDTVLPSILFPSSVFSSTSLSSNAIKWDRDMKQWCEIIIIKLPFKAEVDFLFNE